MRRLHLDSITVTHALWVSLPFRFTIWGEGMGSNCATWVPKPWWQIKRAGARWHIVWLPFPVAHLFASSCQCGNITVCKLASRAFKEPRCLSAAARPAPVTLLRPITHPVVVISMYN